MQWIWLYEINDSRIQGLYRMERLRGCYSRNVHRVVSHQMSEVSDIEMGRMLEKMDSLEQAVRENNQRLDSLEAQLAKTKGFGLGLAVGLIGVSSATASFITKWMTN